MRAFLTIQGHVSHTIACSVPPRLRHDKEDTSILDPTPTSPPDLTAMLRPDSRNKWLVRPVRHGPHTHTYCLQSEPMSLLLVYCRFHKALTLPFATMRHCQCSTSHHQRPTPSAIPSRRHRSDCLIQCTPNNCTKHYCSMSITGMTPTCLSGCCRPSNALNPFATFWRMKTPAGAPPIPLRRVPHKESSVRLAGSWIKY